ncbi:uncharacterized protein LOC109539560 [Dendroctonus ponderosae]|uniref:uncharacterized protein LOC109539560 n=1 Tax=Dendroctonus ponderosae TaxID=77166 RepID=UPI002035440D|nr:uncharacterized protein LOC109539560 [Dendroctonus ponderosae]
MSRMNNNSQFITSPFFPQLYPADLSTEYVIKCHSKIPCRINLIFTDFLMGYSSILEFFDWNGQRLYVISGNIFRPPVIVSSGPSLVVRFYANGASNLGFKASYGFTLGNLDDLVMRSNTDCGGQVNNLGGGITMMNMTVEGPKFYDCLWIIQIPSSFLHRKTHLYVKVVKFTDFAGPTKLIMRKGVTSNEAVIETLKYPPGAFEKSTKTEHVVSIKEGFYVSLRGLFKAESRVAIVYAAFNYKDCFSGLDFLCQNMRCISALLNCDGFDHCGDNSDESPTCSEDPKDHRDFSKIPNFRFPKAEPYSDLTMATAVFLLCTFGLIGIIIAMTLLLYRVNMRTRHHRQIQDHIETIHAILEEGVGEIEEDIIIADEPPDYEHPPEYSDVFQYIRKVACGSRQKNRHSQVVPKPSQSTSFAATGSEKSPHPNSSNQASRSSSTSRSCQTSPLRLPQSPPPAYDNEIAGASQKTDDRTVSFPKKMFIDIGVSLRQNIRKCKSDVFAKHSIKTISFSEPNSTRYYSESDLIGLVHSRKAEDFNVGKRSFSANDLFF